MTRGKHDHRWGEGLIASTQPRLCTVAQAAYWGRHVALIAFIRDCLRGESTPHKSKSLFKQSAVKTRRRGCRGENKAINRADNGERRNLGIGQRHTAPRCTRASFGEGQEEGNESIARVNKLTNRTYGWEREGVN